MKIGEKGRECARGSNSNLNAFDYSEKILSPSYIYAALSREMLFEKDSKISLREQRCYNRCFYNQNGCAYNEKKTSCASLKHVLILKNIAAANKELNHKRNTLSFYFLESKTLLSVISQSD